MTVEQAISEPGDQFPVGMRVLAVDDDPTCLTVLQGLLRRCQYQVTTTSQAIIALKLLRENKNQFDLVISDVHMPDMDGFKLLELVGLEMDLPVIMLSANGDPKLVMKGITHGACDYLLKPVRIEELKNIWQHVVRRKKFDKKDQNASDSQEKNGHNEAGGMGNADQNAKNNKKRKDQDEDEDEEHDENGNDNEDPSAQKKPRVVWTVELHRKFVGAVNQLGVDKAVPKKILELMNVDKLTRENVASHLQKYRLYLKRISCVANQQANLAAALGSADPSYLRMGSLNIQNLNGLGNFHPLSGSDQFHNAAFRSLPPRGMLGRLNTPVGLGMHGLPSSGMIQLGQAKNSGNINNNQNRFNQVMIPGNYNGGILQGMPMSLELDQLQHSKGVKRIEELPTAVDNTTVLPISSSLQDAKLTGCSNNPLLGVTNDPLVLERCPQEPEGTKIFGNQSSVTMASLNSGSSTHLPDLGRCSDNWSSTVLSSGVQPNSFALGDCFQQANLLPGNLSDSVSTITFQSGNISDFSSRSPAPNQLHDSKPDLCGQGVTISRNTGQIVRNVPQEWDAYRQDAPHQSNLICSSMNSSFPTNCIMGSVGQCMDPGNTTFHRNMTLGAIGQSNFVDPLAMKCNVADNPAMETSVNLKPGYLVGQQKPQSRYISNNVGSLEDLASAMMKQEQVKPSGHFGSNPGSFGTCI
ncbi:hypothetical protein SLE2022_185710 [Rubroshorea leprosula]